MIFLRLLYAVFFISSLGLTVNAQPGTLTSSDESDPKARAVLDKLRKKYEGYKSIKADFKLGIEIPEQSKEEQSGSLQKAGDKYRMDMEMQSVISDGTSLWLIMHPNKEVQINNAPDPEETEGEILSPESLFTIYERDNFVFMLTNEYADQGTIVQRIDFKPLDNFSDYTKLVLLVDKQKNELLEMRAVARDGSRYSFSIENFQANPKLPDSTFSFDKSKYPNYYVEDLRY